MISISLVEIVTFLSEIIQINNSFAAAAMTHPDKLTVFIAIKYSRLKVAHTFQAFEAGDRAKNELRRNQTTFFYLY